MRRLLLILMLTAACAFAQGDEGGEGDLQVWKWANFALLAAGIAYVVGKNAGPFFSARAAAITKDIRDSERIRQEAEERAAAVDKRLDALESEIAALRTDSQLEAKAETERLTAQTRAEIAKVKVHAEQEISSAAKAARMDLRRYSAELAIELAAKKVQAGMTPATEDGLVSGFVRDLQ